MSRTSRSYSQSGIYHILFCGINQQNIFEEKADYERFIEITANVKSQMEFEIYAYCLMSNHIHILLKVEKEDLEQIMKRIAGSYVYWYNWKYYRKGHLFQDRFKSEPVEDDEYFLTVMRYIHQNPVKSEIVNSVSEYKYSSYYEYEKESQIVDTEFAFSILSKENFLLFNNKINDEKCLDIEEVSFRLSDADAKEIIRKISKCESFTIF